MGWAPRGPENQQVSGISFDLPGGESTAAALRRAEQERDEALAEVSGVRASLAELADEVEDLKATLAMRTGQLKAATRERDLARAELASAQQELSYVQRAERDEALAELAAMRAGAT